MISKNQILVFISSFLIAGFFLLSTPEAGVCGIGTVCCRLEITDLSGRCRLDANECATPFEGTVCESGLECTRGNPCECPPPPIPTLNQWGMIIMVGLLGLFALIALRIMRRRNEVKPSS